MKGFHRSPNVPIATTCNIRGVSSSMLTCHRSSAIARLTLLALLLSANGRANAADSPVVKTQIALRAGSRDVRAELFEQANGALHPAVIVLHGAGGTLLDGP
ncbi:MAG: hypothetical protein M3Z22_08295, partial [Verrucomicrobiota bacterium]|nr:hypothetical protein [Verrucomicrobiota bacterium]